MAYSLDLSPLILFLLITEEGSGPGKIQKKTEKYIFHKADKAGFYSILFADAEVLGVDPLEKGGDCQ